MVYYLIYINHTEYLGSVFPSIISITCDIPGRFKTDESIGTCRATLITVGRKSPNKLRNPKDSTHSPTTLQRSNTNRMPKKNRTAPAIRSRLNYKTIICSQHIHIYYILLDITLAYTYYNQI
jgi:hypothetical protein